MSRLLLDEACLWNIIQSCFVLVFANMQARGLTCSKKPIG